MFYAMNIRIREHHRRTSVVSILDVERLEVCTWIRSGLRYSDGFLCSTRQHIGVSGQLPHTFAGSFKVYNGGTVSKLADGLFWGCFVFGLAQYLVSTPRRSLSAEPNRNRQSIDFIP